MLHMRLKSITLIAALSALTLLTMTSFALAETRIASWNIMRMSDDNKDMQSVVKIISHFDLIALQEVMSEEGLLTLVSDLQQETGTEWGVMSSHAIGRGPYKEIYAFVWRKSHVSYVDSAVVYLDSKDVLAREPLSARISTPEDGTFILSNIHVLYGKNKSDRVPEIRALFDYWSWLGEAFPNEQYFVTGDFNMPPSDRSFEDLKRFASPAITSGATTLSSHNGKFANLYDNIWVPNGLKANMRSGIFDFPKALGIDHKTSRKMISDHAPVYIILDKMDEATGLYDGRIFEEWGSANTPKQEQTLLVRGNSNSQIYHLPGCPNYADMQRSTNLIEFKDETAAISTGFRKAKNCEFTG